MKAKALCIALGLLASSPAQTAQWHSTPGGNSVQGQVNFTAELRASNELAIESHDIGNNMVAYVTTYQELHSPCEDKRPACGPLGQTVETIAYLGDSLDVDASTGTAVARRYRHDGWPEPIRIARK